MAAHFLRFRVGKTIAAFSILSLMLIGYSLAVSFPIQSLSVFLGNIRLFQSGGTIRVTYPPAVFFATIEDRSASVRVLDKDKARVKFQLRIAEPYASDVTALGIHNNDIDDFVILGEIPSARKADVQAAAAIIRRLPIDYAALRKIGLSQAHEALLMLSYWGKPVRVIAVPTDSFVAKGGRHIYIRTHILWINSLH